MKILVIDDEQPFADMIATRLRSDGHAVDVAYDGSQAMARAVAQKPDLALCDLHLPDADGLELLPRLLAAAPEAKVVMMTGDDGTSTAVKAMKAGAEDYLQKPFHLDELLVIVEKLGKRGVTEHSLRSLHSANIYQALEHLRVYMGAGMGKAYEELSLAAEHPDVTVLIQGETGSGKEHAARLVHQLSNRYAGPFIELNCASIPESLVESELFGVEAGAYTDAKQRRVGLVEAAQGGTLFLDEMEELPPAAQAKLLKVLEDRELRRVGSTGTVRLELRIIAATNKDLVAETQAGRFRSDLFYRLSLFTVHLPPLRERRGDIPDLARFFYDRACKTYGRRMGPMSAADVAELSERPWLGNVRELRNVVENAVLRSHGEAAVFSLALRGHGAPPVAPVHKAPHVAVRPLKDAVDEAVATVKRQLLQSALAQADGNKTQAAKLLDVDYKTILNLMKSLNIEG